MDENSGTRPASGRSLSSWRRLEPANSLITAKFLSIVLAFTLGAALVQLALWLSNYSDYVGADPDDAMRLVEVRDYLAGQGWFDLTQYRLGPDGGTLMHWSRLIDWPIAQLIKVYGLFLGPMQAEAAALATWPLLLILPLLASAGLASYRLGGKAGMIISLILCVVFLAAIVRFRPGAIDHHNVQLVLVTFIAAMLLDPLARASNFAAAAIAGAIALAIGAETTPLVAVAAVAVALLWATHGERYRGAAIGFGATFAVVTGVIFFATTPTPLWSTVTCDTLSVGYLALSAAGGAMLAVSALALSGHAPFVRLGALAGTGVLVLALAIVIAPQCLRSPLSDLDPLLQTYWISTIREAQSIVSELALNPENIGAYYAVGIIASMVAILRIMRRELTIPHAVLLGLIGVSWAVSAVQVRGMLFANFLAFIPLSILVADLRALYLERPKDRRAAMAFAFSALLSVPSVWALVGVVALDPGNALAGMTRSNNAAKTDSEPSAACVTADAIAELAKAPPGRVLASFNEGPALLRFTPHSVISANYHRNQRGMLAALHAGMAKPQDALGLLEDQDIRYVLVCNHDSMADKIAKDYPAGLFAALGRGDVPGYLEELPGDRAPGFRIYEMIQR